MHARLLGHPSLTARPHSTLAIVVANLLSREVQGMTRGAEQTHAMSIVCEWYSAPTMVCHESSWDVPRCVARLAVSFEPPKHGRVLRISRLPLASAVVSVVHGTSGPVSALGPRSPRLVCASRGQTACPLAIVGSELSIARLLKTSRRPGRRLCY